jgi:aryl-alcohol dehydrogenase-like predicted oxidoreductase
MPASLETAQIAGSATPSGTIRFRDRFASIFDADFYRDTLDGLAVSSIGIGTYLGECDDRDDALYRDSIAGAVRRGINVIDTAINYRCQRSELAVGQALQTLVRDAVIARDEVIICTKGGYIPLDRTPPGSRAAYQQYVQREFHAAGVMTAEDVVAGGHCLTPGYLAHQLARSRSNLGTQCVDVYYLHNPEQQLDVIDRARFIDRMRDAFALLEERVAQGEIGRYGCATWNGFRVPPGHPGHLSLAELVGIATEVGGKDHSFRVIQVPINLAMVEAVRQPTQRLRGDRLVTLLEAAREFDIAVVASASLLQSKLASGLPAQLRDIFPALHTDAQRALMFTRTLPGVSTALIGMKSLAHLEENLEAVSAH